MSTLRDKRIRVLTLAAAALLVVAVAGAWALEKATRVAEPPGSRVSVERAGKVLATFDMNGLRALGTKRVVDQGKAQEGPALLKVLEASGVTSFTQLRIVGVGLRDSGKLELARAKVGPDVVLDLADRGTAKIAGPGIAYGDRVRDITRIEVQ